MGLVERSRRFLSEGVWLARRESLPRVRRAFYDVVRVGYMTILGFADDLCLTRASSLAFATMLALVPVLALTFAVLRGLGWRGERLESLILDKVTLLSPEAIDTIVSYIDATNFTGLGVFGAAFLLVTFISVVTNIEGAFNAIWDNTPGRTLGRQVTDYFGVMVIAPVLLAAAISLTATVESNAIVAWMKQAWGVGYAVRLMMAYAAWGVVWALFAFLYVFIPNTRVRVVPAIVAGVLAGTVWQTTHWAYLRFQIGMQNYNAVYGTLAQLPLLMIWIYVSWVIVLLGAEVAWAIQTVQVYSRERRAASKSHQAFNEWIALSVAVELARAAEGKAEPPTTERLAQLFDVPLRTIRDVMTALHQASLAHTAGANNGCCYLSLAPERITIATVLEAMRGKLPPEQAHPVAADSAKRARELLEEADVVTVEAFGARTLKEAALLPPSLTEAGAQRALASVERAGLGTARRDPRRGAG
jgi:membrane protein